jgi:hypothetical protein
VGRAGAVLGRARRAQDNEGGDEKSSASALTA